MAHRLHRGVYAVGHARSPVTAMPRCACWPAVAAPCSAIVGSVALGLCPAARSESDVTSPPADNAAAAIRVHRAPAIAERRRRIQEGSRSPPLPRTLLDLAADAPRRLPSAIDRAERLGLLDLRESIDARALAVVTMVAANVAPALAALSRAGLRPRSSERLIPRRLGTTAGLPRPSLNTWVDEFEIDAYWEAERFAVEVDSWETHGSRQAFEDDRLRRRR